MAQQTTRRTTQFRRRRRGGNFRLIFGFTPPGAREIGEAQFDGSTDQAPLAEVVEDQLVERVLIGGEDVGDPPPGTPLLQAADEGVEVVLVPLQERGADGDL